MARKLPWRTVIVPPESGRFTNEQIEEAIRIVKERRERRERRAKERNSSVAVESRPASRITSADESRTKAG